MNALLRWIWKCITSKNANIPASTGVAFQPFSFFVAKSFPIRIIFWNCYFAPAPGISKHSIWLVFCFSLFKYVFPPCHCFGFCFHCLLSKAANISVKDAWWDWTADTKALKHQPSFLEAIFPLSLLWVEDTDTSPFSRYTADKYFKQAFKSFWSKILKVTSWAT